MRIVSGTDKGRVLKSLPGETTKPTTSRVREAWASTVLSLFADRDFEKVAVLDAFAGSGALGLEMLSRGVDSCVFVERDHKAFAVLKENVKNLQGANPKVHTIKADSFTLKYSERFDQKDCFDLLILDPPYAFEAAKIKNLLAILAQHDLIKAGTVLSYEHGKAADSSLDALELTSPLSTLSLELVRNKRYGTIYLDYYLCK